MSFDWVRRPEDREDEQQPRLDAIRGRGAGLSAAPDLADGFAGLIHKHSEGTLSDGLASEEGIRGDEVAVQSGGASKRTGATARWQVM